MGRGQRLTIEDGARIHGWRSTCTVAASAEVTSPRNPLTLAIPIIMRSRLSHGSLAADLALPLFPASLCCPPKKFPHRADR